jgi:hypothetical protein
MADGRWRVLVAPSLVGRPYASYGRVVSSPWLSLGVGRARGKWAKEGQRGSDGGWREQAETVARHRLHAWQAQGKAAQAEGEAEEQHELGEEGATSNTNWATPQRESGGEGEGRCCHDENRDGWLDLGGTRG